MMRECISCHAPFAPADLAKVVSKGIESERKALGVDGVLFRCYTCSHCRHENLFVDLIPLEGETREQFVHRRDELEAAIRLTPHAGVDIALVEKRSE